MEASDITITNQPYSFQHESSEPAIEDTNSRLNALIRRNAEIARQKSLVRRESEEFEAALMRRPIAPERAYGFFGLLLGTFPPAAIFAKLWGHQIGFNGGAELLVLCLFMNVICAGVGYGMGKAFGKTAVGLEKTSWAKMMVLTPLIGALWAIVTGFAGAMIVFVIGGFFGAMFALPVGILAFPLFAILHRLMNRAGKIENKHLLPIAFGLTLTIAAFILSM